MFWQNNEENSLDVLLKSDEISLNSVLDNPYTLQEIRNGNQSLVQYLIKDEILIEMMNIALHSTVDQTLPIKEQYKYSNMCTEVFSTFSTEIATAVFGSEPCMNLIVTTLDKPMNSVVASFFFKIVGSLFNRDPRKCIDFLMTTSFVSKCIDHLEHGAMGELIFKFVSSPVEPDLTQIINQWMVEGGIVEGLISAFSSSKHPQVHYVACYVYTEIVGWFREVLYQSEEKVINCLLGSLTSEESITRIMDAMLQRDEEGLLNESIVAEGMELMEKLLETNTVWQRPSGTVDGDKVDTWMGGIPESFSQVQGWQPDPERLAEKVIGSRSEEILKGVLNDLQLDPSIRGNSWKYLLDLIVEILDTNWGPSHLAIKNAFKNVPLTKFLDVCLSKPELNILHRLVHKIVEYPLFSSCTPESPLIVYLFNDADVISYIRKHLTECLSTPLPSNLAQISKRSFLFHLGCSFQRARMNGCNKDRLEAILKACTKWHELLSDLDKFTERNKMAETDRAPSFTSSKTYNVEVDVSPQQASNQMALATLHEYESTNPSQQLPTHFDAPLSSLVTPFDQQSYSMDTRVSMDITSAFTNKDSTIDEIAFENMCSLKWSEMGDLAEEDEWPGDKNIGGYESSDKSEKSETSIRSDDWPGVESTSKVGKKEDEWPGEGETSNGKKEERGSFPLEWDTKQIKGEQLTDDWPTSPSVTSPTQSSQSSASPAVWADLSSSMGGPSDWTASDPVMAGIASGMMSASIEKSSEC
ncbi:saps-1 [Pristionchus pacificus]|uniref:Saps-1 n=1 Tax=Pristionchus pacificus TaxID=54126 RepID=A0A2A6BZ01_PRIPA|nr:saps-1 [Pristionchus pacificus]|eukprot:PDM71120.1 saps-1 [Pristionchus pacificus]